MLLNVFGDHFQCNWAESFEMFLRSWPLDLVWIISHFTANWLQLPQSTYILSLSQTCGNHAISLATSSTNTKVIKIMIKLTNLNTQPKSNRNDFPRRRSKWHSWRWLDSTLVRFNLKFIVIWSSCSVLQSFRPARHDERGENCETIVLETAGDLYSLSLRLHFLTFRCRHAARKIISHLLFRDIPFHYGDHYAII